MAFPLCMVDSWCLSGKGGGGVSHSLRPNKLWCHEVILCLPLVGPSSDVVSSEQAHLKDVYKSTFLHVCYSGALPFVLFFKRALKCNFMGFVISVGATLSFCVWSPICVNRSPRGVNLSSSISPIIQSSLYCRTKLRLMQKNIHEYCVHFSFERRKHYVFSYPSDCMNIERSFKPQLRWNTPSVVMWQWPPWCVM